MTLCSLAIVRLPPPVSGRGLHAHVHDRVDVLAGDHLGDHRVADVGADERHVAEVLARRDDVDADHPLDAGVGGQPAREAAAEVSRDSGDEHDAAHGDRSVRPGYLPARRRWMRVFFSSLRCFFLAIRLRRFLTTEPTTTTFRATTRRPGADVPDQTDWRRGQPNRRSRGAAKRGADGCVSRSGRSSGGGTR